MPLLNGYFFLFVSAILVIIASAIVTIKIIEPMLGEYQFTESDNSDMTITDEERKAVKKAGRNVLIFLIILIVSCIPQNSFLRNPINHSLIFWSSTYAVPSIYYNNSFFPSRTYLCNNCKKKFKV